MAARGRIRLSRILAVAALAIAVLFGAGFYIFASTIPSDEIKLDRSADGIVVLTGGASRIVDGIELLAAGRGRRLLISGVHPSTTPGELIRKTPEVDRLFACCVDLGHQAQNTIGNAIEAGGWARDHKFRSLIVVTSGWHMPRALIELQRELPGVALIPYPVITERFREGPWWSDAHMLRVFFVEYVKYVASYARTRLDSTDIGATLRTSERRPPS
jgi:uncharacterized SAM-binding protein YcdF (DUF218 family)